MTETSRVTIYDMVPVNSPKSTLRVAILFIVIPLAALVLASACGGGMMDSGGMHDQMHRGGSQMPQTPVISSASQVTVEISDFDFFPRDLTIQHGSVVNWVNRDAAPHDATDGAGAWGTGTLTLDESATITFDSPGAYQYLCTIHPNMKATLNVV